MNEIVIDTTQPFGEAKKGFRLVITSLDTHEIVLSKNIKAIVGAICTDEDDDGADVAGLVLTQATVPAILHVAEYAVKSATEVSERAKSDFNKMLLREIMNGLARE